MVQWVGATNGANPPPQPAHAVGDKLVTAVSGKPETVGAGVIDQGFTHCGLFTGGAGAAGADSGPTYIQVFEKVAADTTTTAPTATSGFAGSNNATWAIYAVRPDTGKTWRDTPAGGADWMVGGSDADSTADNLLRALTAAFDSGFEPDGANGDGLLLLGCAQSDAGSGIGAVTASATGLTGGTHTARSYVETSVGNDSCSTGHTWLGFSGTPSAGVDVSHTVTGLAAPVGTVVAVALRQTGPLTVNLGLAEETDTALAVTITVGAVTVPLGIATETDTALGMTIAAGSVVSLGIAQETDAALAVEVTELTPITLNLGIAEETDTAQPLTLFTTSILGLATETDTALAVTVAMGPVSVTLGIAEETDTALGVTVSNALILALGLVTEIDTALPFAAVLVLTTIDTDTSNNIYAVMFLGEADVIWEPPVVPRPALLQQGESAVKAKAIDSIEVSLTGQATIVEQVEQIRRHRDRILIGGQDWTYRDGVEILLPDYELLEPFGYGDGGTIVLEQIDARDPLARLGHNRLKRVKLGSEVVYQRVDDDPDSETFNEVVATDYVGFVLRQGRRGNKLALAVAGEMLGRAGLKWHPAPIWRRVRAAGVQLFNTVVGLGLRATPRLFPDLTIRLAARGGMREDQWLLDTTAQLTTGDGDQWTVMPVTDRGPYTVRLKDRETINATVYFDNQFVIEDLGEDLAEKPNRVWINAVAPDGQRIMHASAPNLQATEVPEFPTVDGNPMTIDDTDEDTSTGDGVTVLVWRLTFAGLLDREDLPGGFDEDVAGAVRDFQREAGMANLTGSVDEDTWNALWDNLVTNYSIQYAAQRPAIQDDKVQKFDRSGNGAIIGLHEGYDETEIVVDLPLEMGPVGSRRQAWRMARHKLHQVGQSDWVGTITLTSGLIAGEHTPGDTLTPELIIPNRAVRPGWNVWEPHFDGGTLFHVVACKVRDKGWVVDLVVDTRARDAMEAWEVHRRNAENRYQPSRYLGGPRRRSTASQDTVTPWDKIVGQTDRKWSLTGGEWTEIPVPSGQAGTVQQTEITLGDPAEFAVIVAERQIPLERLNRKVHPLEDIGEDATPWYEQQAIRSWLKTYRVRVAWGTFRQPCGYDPRAKTNPQTGTPTGAPVTGVFFDDSSWGYDCGLDGAALYKYIWLAADNTLPRQRVFTQQLDGSGT